MTLAKTTRDAIFKSSDQIQQIAARHGALNVRVFGSVARNEATPKSDLDLLVELGPNPSPWFPAGLILDLEKLLDCKVEVVTERALNPLLRERVLNEAIAL